MRNGLRFGDGRLIPGSKSEGRVFVLIYTMRDSAIRLISARKTNKKDVREPARAALPHHEWLPPSLIKLQPCF